jgi:hypothetical protein
MLLVQAFLRGACVPDGDGYCMGVESAITFLQNFYGIYAKRHRFYPNLVQFSYDQIDSAKHRSEPFVLECRGLILNQDDDWNVVAYPFSRFFNYGEECAAAIDWSTARVQEKVDGSLMILYYYRNHWEVATKGSPDASGDVGDWGFTFRKLFWRSAEEWKGGFCKSGELNPDYTYMIELTSPWNRVVCDYTKLGPLGTCITGEGKTGYVGDGSRLTLIGVRDNKTLQEIPVSVFADDWYYTVKEFPLNSFEDVVAAASHLNPLEQEGYVIVDMNFNRVKVKSPAYVAIHHLTSNFSKRRILELVKMGEAPEVLAYYPEYMKIFDEVKVELERFIFIVENELMNVVGTVGYGATQKEFALEAVKTKFPGALFAVKSGKAKSIREFIMGLSATKLEEILPNG